MSSTVAPDVSRILVHGASGRMGAALLRLQPEAAQTALVAAVSRGGGRTEAGVALTAATRLDQVPDFDVAIDFSLPEAFDAILDLCLARNAAFVSGTTGLEDAQRARLDAAAQTIPVLWSANFSLGIAVLGDLVRRAAAALPGWACEIVETHHVHKKDAPSGTALLLGAAVQAAGRDAPHYVSHRTGDVIGDHRVRFVAAEERIELNHSALHRDVFARGALHAARAIAGRAPGNYRLIDLLDVP